MKTKAFCIFMTCFVMGLFILLSAFTPEQGKENKSITKTQIPPPSPWTLNIEVTDACDTIHCPNALCDLDIVLEAASYPDCKGLYPLGSNIHFVKCQSLYSAQIPDAVQCVYVTFAVHSGSCNLNPLPGCSCKGDGTVKIRVCQ
jgi:hypothetical protein